MAVNKYNEHVLILPEDDANRQLANGFMLEFDTRQVQVLPVAGGWRVVCSDFKKNHVSDMRKYPERYLVLLIDFDDDLERLNLVKQDIPEDLSDRVFVLGSLGEPEDLRKQLGSFEKIGKKMADDCRNGTRDVWEHPLLKHNERELARLSKTLCNSVFAGVPA